MIVDADLRAALESGRLAGAGLDVFHHEPQERDSPLLDVPNLILSPGVDGVDAGAIEAMAGGAAR